MCFCRPPPPPLYELPSTLVGVEGVQTIHRPGYSSGYFTDDWIINYDPATQYILFQVIYVKIHIAG